MKTVNSCITAVIDEYRVAKKKEEFTVCQVNRKLVDKFPSVLLTSGTFEYGQPKVSALRLGGRAKGKGFLYDSDKSDNEAVSFAKQSYITCPLNKLLDLHLFKL